MSKLDFHCTHEGNLNVWRAFVFTAVIALAWASPSESGWSTYSVNDGLAAGNVIAIAEDSSGNLWFGTYGGTFGGGVSRYDGVSWRTFTTADGLAHNFVYAITEDSSGNLWFGTDAGGVSKYDSTGTWSTYNRMNTNNGLASDRVYAITEDSSGNLWFGTDAGGVSKYDRAAGTWTTYNSTNTNNGLASNTVWAITEDGSGNLWFGTWGGGVSQYDRTTGTWTTYNTTNTNNGLANNFVRRVAEDGSGNLWFGTGGGGVSKYDRAAGTWTTYNTSNSGLVSDDVYGILVDSSGNLWFGTWGEGVSMYDRTAGTWTTYTTANSGLASDVVVGIAEDSPGNLWFGTFGIGVSRFDRADWRTFKTGEVPEIEVRAILEDSSRNLWFGTRQGGAIRYNGADWDTFRTDDGLASDYVNTICEDSSGKLWFGTEGSGVSKYDAAAGTWATYDTSNSGLASNEVEEILKDSSGNLWFATWEGGVSRYNGADWDTFTTADGLANNDLYAIFEDSSRKLWFGTWGGGVSVYDPVTGTWTTFNTSNSGLACDFVLAIAEDSSGNLWFGLGSNTPGVSRYNGADWDTFTTADGLAHNDVRHILKDSSGNLWFATWGGVSHYDGVNWVTFAPNNGPRNGPECNVVHSIAEDSSGNIWLGTSDFETRTGCGVTRHTPDRIPPQTVIFPRPPRLSTSTVSTIAFYATLNETQGIVFSHSFDGGPWSEWAPDKFYQAVNLSDGEHVFVVKARDRMGNVDSTPAVCRFEIDATPPVPVIADPASGEAVRGVVQIHGTAADLRFRKYLVGLRPSGAASWDTLFGSATAVSSGKLCDWNTESFPDGTYELRLSVTDTLGLTGVALVTVVVDNHEPWAAETVPSVVSSASGGDIYTTNGEMHLYFPPHAFSRDTEVNMFALSDSLVPDTLANGAIRVLAGYQISFDGADLLKPAILELSYEAVESLPAQPTIVLYALGADSTWGRLGGTVDRSANRISTPLTKPGRYSVFAEAAGAPGVSTLTTLSVTPRVFSPQGSFASTQAAIGFELGRAGSVTVRIYNRAGRLVREVASGVYLGAGANMVRWDGRDSGGEVVGDGIYLVTVEALGQKRVKTVSVVR